MKTVLVVLLLAGSFLLGGRVQAQRDIGLMGVIESVDYSTGIFVVRLTRIPKATKLYFRVDDPKRTIEIRPKEWVTFHVGHGKSKIKKVPVQVIKVEFVS